MIANNRYTDENFGVAVPFDKLSQIPDNEKIISAYSLAVDGLELKPTDAFMPPIPPENSLNKSDELKATVRNSAELVGGLNMLLGVAFGKDAQDYGFMHNEVAKLSVAQKLIKDEIVSEVLNGAEASMMTYALQVQKQREDIGVIPLNDKDLFLAGVINTLEFDEETQTVKFGATSYLPSEDTTTTAMGSMPSFNLDDEPSRDNDNDKSFSIPLP